MPLPVPPEIDATRMIRGGCGGGFPDRAARPEAAIASAEVIVEIARLSWPISSGP